MRWQEWQRVVSGPWGSCGDGTHLRCCCAQEAVHESGRDGGVAGGAGARAGAAERAAAEGCTGGSGGEGGNAGGRAGVGGRGGEGAGGDGDGLVRSDMAGRAGRVCVGVGRRRGGDGVDGERGG